MKKSIILIIIAILAALIALSACGNSNESTSTVAPPSYYDAEATMEWMWADILSDKERAFLCDDYYTMEKPAVLKEIADQYYEAAPEELYQVMNKEC